MSKVKASENGRQADSQPRHGPWGHKDEDLLSNKKAAEVFPPAYDVNPVPKPNIKEK